MVELLTFTRWQTVCATAETVFCQFDWLALPHGIKVLWWSYAASLSLWENNWWKFSTLFSDENGFPLKGKWRINDFPRTIWVFHQVVIMYFCLHSNPIWFWYSWQAIQDYKPISILGFKQKVVPCAIPGLLVWTTQTIHKLDQYFSSAGPWQRFCCDVRRWHEIFYWSTEIFSWSMILFRLRNPELDGLPCHLNQPFVSLLSS